MRYEQEAQALRAKAEQHRAMLVQYQARAQGAFYGSWDEEQRAILAEHCALLTRRYQQASEQTLKLAQLHRQFADQAER